MGLQLEQGAKRVKESGLQTPACRAAMMRQGKGGLGCTLCLLNMTLLAGTADLHLRLDLCRCQSVTKANGHHAQQT